MPRREPGSWRAAVGGCCLSLALAAPLAAQEPQPPGPDAATVRIETLEGLVQDLEDPARREELIARLRALIDAAQPETDESEGGFVDPLVAFVQQIGQEAGHTLTGIVSEVEEIPERLRDLEATLADPPRRSRLLTDTALVGGLVLAALGALALVAWLLRSVRGALARRSGDQPLRPFARIWRLAVRFVVDCVAPAVAMVVAFVGLSVLPMSTGAGAVALAVVAAAVATVVARRAVDAVLAPHRADLRPFAVGDAASRHLAKSLGRLATLAIVGFFAIAAIAALGADADLLDALRGIYALLLLVAAIVFVLRFRRWPRGFDADDGAETAERAPEPAAAEAPARAEPGWRRTVRTLTRLWWIVALVYAVGLYSLWIGGMADAFGRALRATGLTLLFVAVGVALSGLAGWGLRKGASRLASATRSLPAVRRRIPYYLTIARVAVGTVLGLVVAGFVFEAWGIRALLVLQTTLMQTVLTTGLGVVAVLLLAFATIDVSTALTEAWLARREAAEESSAKVRTLVPLAQKTIKLVVWVLTVVTLMGQVGISIGPILASIGVLGLAVGFGAQTLVKDVITGVFILLEDAVSVGDIVMIDGTGGLVEAINIRTIRLRDLSGVVHTIPYSTVGQFANLTKEFSYYLIECGVAYREDVDAVIEVLRELGADLQADPKFGPSILEPIEILGLDRFEDSAVVIRARLKTRPAQQWSVGREFNRRMKRVFDERGIEIPFPHRTIYVGQDKAGKSPPLFVEDPRRGDAG